MPVDEEMGSTVPWNRVDQGTSTGFELQEVGPDILVVDEPEHWHHFWLRHTAGTVDPGPPPEVDLEDHWVAVLLLGEQRTGGFAIACEEVYYDAVEDRYTLLYEVTEPGPEDIVTQALTRPYDIVSVFRVPETPPLARLRPAD